MSPTAVEIGFSQEFMDIVAIKHIYKDQLNDHQKRQALIECSAHSKFKHENIVELLDCFQTPKEYILVLRYMNNATYFVEKIDESLRPVPQESKMKHYMLQILRGLQYIHQQGYIHCDIKLENLFCELQEGAICRNVKIGDMGLLHPYDINTGLGFLEERCGTMNYMAPELKSNSMITPKVDVWSLGVVLYKMSVGYKPTAKAGFKYGNGPIPFEKKDWKKLSPELQDVIRQMLEVDPQKRISVEGILNHAWLSC